MGFFLCVFIHREEIFKVFKAVCISAIVFHW